VAGVLHDDEIPIDTGLVRALVARSMPHYVDLPVRHGQPLPAAMKIFKRAGSS
jgi:hypothetical protein